MLKVTYLLDSKMVVSEIAESDLDEFEKSHTVIMVEKKRSIK